MKKNCNAFSKSIFTFKYFDFPNPKCYFLLKNKNNSKQSEKVSQRPTAVYFYSMQVWSLIGNCYKMLHMFVVCHIILKSTKKCTNFVKSFFTNFDETMHCLSQKLKSTCFFFKMSNEATPSGVMKKFQKLHFIFRF